jgi:hypothetical protein
VSENGEAPVVNELILKFTASPWSLAIEGNVENQNVAMAMLQEALRTMEMQWRLGYAKEAQAEQQKAALDNKRVTEILNRARLKQ